MLSVHTLNAGTPGVEVAHDIAHVGFGNRDCNAHDRLVEHRVGFFEGDLEGFATRNFKGDWLGVNGVFLAINDGNAYIVDGIASHNAFFHDAADALFNRAHVVVGNCAAEDIVREGEIFAFDRKDLEGNFTELARTTGLFLVAVGCSTFTGDMLFVGHFGFEG